MNMAGVDEMVLEYSMYRGYSKTFRAMDVERSNDRTKLFEADKIVTQLFDYLHSGEMDAFISNWDFLNKRFFLHLDQEHAKVARRFKLDLLRYYLVRRQLDNQKQKIIDFFSKYSHEILSSETAAGALRAWYVLPYMDDPGKDSEFAPYFTPRFGEILRNGLQNYLSMVLRTAPLPKLLIMERWFRTEKQQQMRTELEQSLRRVNELHEAVAIRDDRISVLYTIIQALLKFIQNYSSTIENNKSTKKKSNGNLLATDEDLQETTQTMTRLNALALTAATKLVNTHSSKINNISNGNDGEKKNLKTALPEAHLLSTVTELIDVIKI